MEADKVRDRTRDGYYAFQDYAVSHWYDHMASAIETSHEESTDIHERLNCQLKLFVEDYGIPEKRDLCLQDTEPTNMAEIFRRIPQDGRARNQWFDLEWRTSYIRSTIESFGDEASPNYADRDLLWQFYGKRLFKCSRTECNHFTTGFDSKRLRDEHLNRHIRPFICVEQHCPFQALGFGTEAELEAHLTHHHAGNDADRLLFPQPPRRKADDIHKASVRGDIAAVQGFLEAGVDVNATSRRKGGQTPLFLAARGSHLKVCEKLVESGADVNFRGPIGSEQSTALHAAVSSGNPDLIHYFLSRNDILVNQKDKDGRNVLHIAVQARSEAAVRLLLTVDELDLDTWDSSEQTPLHCAVNNGHEAVIKLFLTADKLNQDMWDSFGHTLLYAAAERGHIRVVKLLLATGKVDPDMKDGSGRTPLHAAASNGHEAVVKFLLATGKVDPDMKDGSGRTPLRAAASNGHEAVVKFLLATGKVDPYMKDGSGRTPLHAAASNGREAVVKFLLDTGKVNPDSRTDLKWTPLHEAAMYGHEAVVKLLLMTCEVDPKDNIGETPLDKAEKRRKEAVAKLLLEAGAQRGKSSYNTVLHD